MRDYLIPGGGDGDFAAVLPYLRTDTVPGCEFHFSEDAPHIREGSDYLRRVGFERNVTETAAATGGTRGA